MNKKINGKHNSSASSQLPRGATALKTTTSAWHSLTSTRFASIWPTLFFFFFNSPSPPISPLLYSNISSHSPSSCISLITSRPPIISPLWNTMGNVGQSNIFLA